MGEKKPKMGRPREIPLGTFVWSVRVTDREKQALSKLLKQMRAKKGREK